MIRAGGEQCPDVRKLKIKRGAKAILSLQFLPVHVGVHKTQVRFLHSPAPGYGWLAAVGSLGVPGWD